MAAQSLSFIFGWNSKWPLVLPAVLRHRGNIFITAYIIPKHSFLHGNDPPPVLNSPASLIDYIASYKLSMVHKLCSAEHNTAQCRPAGTRTFRAPASPRSALAHICLVNCAMKSPGLEKRQGEIGVKKSFIRL